MKILSRYQIVQELTLLLFTVLASEDLSIQHFWKKMKQAFMTQ